MLANLKSSIVNFNSRLNANNLRKLIKSQLNEIKGFYLGEFYLSQDASLALAVDKSHHKLVLLHVHGSEFKHSLFHCSDLQSVHMYVNGSSVKSYSNSFSSRSVPGHSPVSAEDKSKSFLKILTNKKEQQSLMFFFDSAKQSDDLLHWFDICRLVIAKAEQTTETMNSRIQVMR